MDEQPDLFEEAARLAKAKAAAALALITANALYIDTVEAADIFDAWRPVTSGEAVLLFSNEESICSSQGSVRPTRWDRYWV